MRANQQAISLILLGIALASALAGDHARDGGESARQMSLNPISKAWLEAFFSGQAVATLVAGQVAWASGSRSRLKFRRARQAGLLKDDD